VVSLGTDRIGRVVESCPRCARREAGICRHCPQPVGGKRGIAIFCPKHLRLHVNARVMRWQRSLRGSSLPEGCPKLSPADAARIGGLKGGRARAEKLTAAERRAIARKAGRAGAAATRAREAERQRKRLAYLGRVA